MRRTLAITVALFVVIALAGCGKVTTTTARKAFVKGLNSNKAFPCTLSAGGSDMRKLKAACKDASTDEAQTALRNQCAAFNEVGITRVQLKKGEQTLQCDVASDCSCE